MKLIAPESYSRFACTAGSCRHTCCKGWEIDIDRAALSRYRRASGALGKKLRTSIVMEGGQAHFRLDQAERCPFLTEQGLCELIITLGEDSLCQVCRDHPRFRSFFRGRTEIGLGLCCEAAAQLTLLDPAPMRLTLLSETEEDAEPLPEEAALLTLREHLIALMQQREQPMALRLNAMCQAVGASPSRRSTAVWARFLLGLEVLDPSWQRQLEGLTAEASPSADVLEALALPMEQLAVSLLYRHMPNCKDASEVRTCVMFTELTLRLIASLTGEDASPERMVEAARCFSAEIEYSEENMEAVLTALKGEAST